VPVTRAKSKSIDERLKALKSLQQVICLAAATVLAFAVTTDRSKDYRAALDELEVFRKVNLNDYPLHVKREFASQEEANRTLLLKAAKQAHLTVRSSTVLSEPFIMNAPPQGAYIRLRDFEDFVTAQHTVGIYLVNDEREVLARLTEQLKQKAQQQVPTTPVPEKRDFYETVTEVNSDLPFFLRWEGFLYFAPVATHVVLHRVSIRTLCEPSWLCAGWGSVGEVDAASFRPAFKGSSALSVQAGRLDTTQVLVPQ
jgi:hypothetical protein